MSTYHDFAILPTWPTVIDSLALLPLTISASTLHGQLCGLLCAEAMDKAESYIMALVGSQKNDNARIALKVLFSMYSISQQQILDEDFSFQLMLPEDHELLFDRAQAFTEWCTGFVQGLEMADIAENAFEEDAQETLQHIREFAEMDCASLDISEEDEKAFMQVSEYTRMAVLRLHNDLVAHKKISEKAKHAH